MKPIVLALLLCGATLSAEKAGPEPVIQVTVRLEDGANVPPAARARATVEASRIFAAVGVRVQWSGRKPAEESGCALAGRLITVTIIPEALDDSSRGAQAVANTHTGAITVFYDRIRYAVAPNPRMAGPVLGHVLAHEVAHVLQVVAQHADSGIMKAQFTMRDFHEMELGELRFTDLDIRLIRAGLASRSCSLADGEAGEAQVAKTPVL